MADEVTILSEKQLEAPLKMAANLDKTATSLDVIIRKSTELFIVSQKTDSLFTANKGLANLNKQEKDLINTQEKLNKEIKKSGDEVDKLGDALGTVAPGATSAAKGIYDMVKASLAFLATPLGLVIAAIGAALYALTAYFKSSEEGQNRLNKIMAIGGAIFEQFMNVVEGVGEALYNAFANPKQALIDFGKFLQDQVVNRFVGMFELIPKLGQSLELLFQGKFSEAGKVAADAVGKVVLGVENATDLFNDFIDQTNKLIQIGIDYGTRMAAIQADLDRKERKLIVDRAKTVLEVAKLRDDAIKLEGEDRIKALEAAGQKEIELSNKELDYAKKALELAELKVKANGDDKEALKELAEAQAKVFEAESTRYTNTLKINKQIEAERDVMAKNAEKDRLKEIEDFKKEIKEKVEAQKSGIMQEAAARQIALEQEVNDIRAAVIAGQITRKEGEEQITALQRKQAAEYVQIQIDTVKKILAVQNLSIKEREKLEAQLAELQQKLIEETYNSLKDKSKLTLQDVENVFQKIASAIDNFFSAITERGQQELDQQVAANKASAKIVDEDRKKAYETELERAGNDKDKKEQLKKDYERNTDKINKERERKDAEIQKKRNELVRKQAIYEKAVSFAQATIDLAQAIIVANTAGPGIGQALAIAVAAAGAIQLAAIAATPIPAAAKGKKNFRGGKILVGELGAELITVGAEAFLSPSHPTVLDLPGGSDIYPTGETMKRLAAAGMGQSERIGSRGDMVYLGKKIDLLNNTIQNKRETHINITERGLEKVIRNGEIRTQILNDLFD